MMVTEKEAREMLCCAGGECGEAHRDANGDIYRYCVGKRCMAWRWDAEQSNPADPLSSKLHCVRGHCGRAGSPSGRPQP